MNRLRIATWNLGHQAGYNGGYRAPAADVARVASDLEADVLVFTEFVHSVRPDLPAALAAVGFTSVETSEDLGRCNHVLIASRRRLERGGFAGPSFDENARSNVLHVRIPQLDLDVFGVRVPWYKSAADVGRMWEWIGGVQAEYAGRRAILLGDLNVAPDGGRVSRPARQGFDSLAASWLRLAPAEGASYFAKRDGNIWPWQLDHIFVTPALKPGPAEYIYATPSARLVNETASHSRDGILSDHAAIMGDVGI